MYDENYCDGCEAVENIESLELGLEFHKKIDEVITEAAKKFLQNEREELKTLRKEVYEKNEEINGFNGEIRKMKNEKICFEEAVKKEYEETLKTKKNNLLEEIFDGMKVGDKIYIIYDDRNRKKCAKCSGTGKKIANIDNETFEVKCPECEGKGFHIYEKKVVAQKEISHFEINNRKTNFTVDIVYDHHYNKSFRMGSSDYYKTKEEAQKKCDEINKKRGVEG